MFELQRHGSDIEDHCKLNMHYFSFFFIMVIIMPTPFPTNLVGINFWKTARGALFQSIIHFSINYSLLLSTLISLSSLFSMHVLC